MGPEEYRSKYASKAGEAQRPRALASAAESGAAAAATVGPAFECRAAPRTPCGLTRATTGDSASSPRTTASTGPSTGSAPVAPGSGRKLAANDRPDILIVPVAMTF